MFVTKSKDHRCAKVLRFFCICNTNKVKKTMIMGFKSKAISWSDLSIYGLYFPNILGRPYTVLRSRTRI